MHAFPFPFLADHHHISPPPRSQSLLTASLSYCVRFHSRLSNFLRHAGSSEGPPAVSAAVLGLRTAVHPSCSVQRAAFRIELHYSRIISPRKLPSPMRPL